LFGHAVKAYVAKNRVWVAHASNRTVSEVRSRKTFPGDPSLDGRPTGRARERPVGLQSTGLASVGWISGLSITWRSTVS
jgi:hypothetical protein